MMTARAAFDLAHTTLATTCRLIAVAGICLLAGGAVAFTAYGLSYAVGRGLTEGKQAAWMSFDGEEPLVVDPE